VAGRPLRFEQLRYLAAIVRNKSFRKAATELGLAQPSLTQAIQNLEDELETTLLERGRTGVELTPVGEAILPFVLNALECERHIRHEADEYSGLLKGSLNIGTVQAASNTLLPGVLRDFCLRYPQIKVYVSESGSVDIAKEVRERRLDLGLVTCMADVPNLEGLRHEDLLESRLVLCVSKENPLAQRHHVSVRDFADQPLIVFRPGYSMHEVIERLFGHRPVRVAYQTNNTESAKRMVVAGLGVFVFAESSIVDDLFVKSGQLAYVPITEEAAGVKVRLIRRADGWFSRPAQIFWTMLVEVAEPFRKQQFRPDMLHR